MSAHLHAAAEAYARVLSVLDPEHAWRVRVGPDGPDAARSTAAPVGADQARSGDEDSDSVLDRASPAAADGPHDDGFEEAA